MTIGILCLTASSIISLAENSMSASLVNPGPTTMACRRDSQGKTSLFSTPSMAIRDLDVQKLLDKKLLCVFYDGALAAAYLWSLLEKRHGCTIISGEYAFKAGAQEG